MSISAYVGLPGHGKSYGAVQNVIIPALKQGRRVFTNIPFNEELFIRDFSLAPVPFDTQDLQNNPNWFSDVFIPGSVLVFDECWRLWPSGLKANAVLAQHKTFLAEHRHFVGEDGFSTEIYFITQDLSQLSNFSRTLVETTFRMVKLISIGFNKSFRVDVYEGAVTGHRPPKSALVNQDYGKFKKDIYQYYKSHTKSVTGLAGNETRTDKRNNSFGRLSIKLGFVFFILVIPFIYWGFGKVAAQYGVKPQPVKSDPVIVQNQSSMVPAKSKKLMPEFLSRAKQFFISHTIKTNGISETFFSVSFVDMKAVLSARDLQKLGYKVLPFNSCLILIEGDDFQDYVMCRSTGKPAGFIQSAVTGSSEKL